jgi:predicted RND superfamily exporter protein
MDDKGLTEAVESVGRAIFLTSATTTLSFVGLFFCRHYGLESMAQFMSMGVPLCFVASITVLPAAISLFRRTGAPPA